MKNFLLKRMVLAAVMIVAGVVGAYADNGDVFATKTKEGVMMTFTVISESSMTCCVGENDYSSNNNSCIDKSVTGTVTIPEKARGYTVVALRSKMCISPVQLLQSGNLLSKVVRA